jgi:hypothetical protein
VGPERVDPAPPLSRRQLRERERALQAAAEAQQHPVPSSADVTSVASMPRISAPLAVPAPPGEPPAVRTSTFAALTRSTPSATAPRSPAPTRPAPTHPAEGPARPASASPFPPVPSSRRAAAPAPDAHVSAPAGRRAAPAPAPAPEAPLSRRALAAQNRTTSHAQDRAVPDVQNRTAPAAQSRTAPAETPRPGVAAAAVPADSRPAPGTSLGSVHRGTAEPDHTAAAHLSTSTDSLPAVGAPERVVAAPHRTRRVAAEPAGHPTSRRGGETTTRVRRGATALAATSPVAGLAHGPRSGRWAARTGVLVALAGVTVIVPVIDYALPGGSLADPAFAEAELPDTVQALTASQASGLPPASLVSADASTTRSELSASRSEERDPLPGCDGATRAAGANGLLATADLCTLWDGHTQMRADAAVSLAVLNQAFVARFGADMCLSSGYRTLAQQRAVKAQKGGLAAAPGKSNHGWGLAVDLCSQETTGAKWTWLNENAPAFGWDNPAWARPGGSGPYERWHWEYTKGVQEDGEYYDG